VDIRCKIEAHLEGGGQVIVHQTRETPFTAVADACEAVARAVRRRSDRLRSRRRGA
jgi:ribosome-associated translation inhibitor RaiA